MDQPKSGAELRKLSAESIWSTSGYCQTLRYLNSEGYLVQGARLPQFFSLIDILPQELKACWKSEP